MAAAFFGNAQTADFNDALPEDWIVNRDLKIGRYNNPANGCKEDTGLITPPIYINTGNQSMHLATTAAATYTTAVSSITLRFDAFAFEPDTRDFSCGDVQPSFLCNSSVKVYIVPANYTSTAVPTGANILGESNFVTLQTGAGANVINIAVGSNLTVGTDYRFLVVGRTGACNISQSQIYVIDNIRVVGTSFNMTFDDAFPAGWNFNRELQLTQYEVPGNCNTTDIGLVTPPVSGNVTNSFLAATPASNYDPATGTINVSFDFFAYDSDTRGFACSDYENSITCNSSVKIFLVAGNYNSTSMPSGAAVLGESDWTDLRSSNPNVVSVPVNITFDANSQYRLIAFTRVRNCNGGDPQVYVIDNIRILEIERAILPVSFKSFTAQRVKNNVTLTWETAMEENNRGFHVQRNIDGNWRNIGFVFSQANGGNSSQVLSYSFKDVNTSTGISQYRLLQVDHDNKARYSEIRSVRGESQQSRIMVYPNPSNTGTVNVMFEDGSALRDVVVSDVSGRVVKQYRNVNGNTLTIENLVDGYYTIQITNNTTAATTVEKVIIKKR